MRYAGASESWSISVGEWDQGVDAALWLRDVERIPVGPEEVVPGPLELDPLPGPTIDPSAGSTMVEGWLFWWRTVVGVQRALPEDVRARLLARPEGLASPTGLAALDAFPELQRLAVARQPELRAWHIARKRAGIEARRVALGDGSRRVRSPEGEAVRAVEAETGQQVAPFRLRLLVLPVGEDRIRSAGDRTFLVPERVRGTEAYDRWLRRLVRALA